MPTPEQLAAWEALPIEGKLWVLAAEYNRLLAETGFMQDWPQEVQDKRWPFTHHPLDQWARVTATVREDPADIRRKTVRFSWVSERGLDWVQQTLHE